LLVVNVGLILIRENKGHHQAATRSIGNADSTAVQAENLLSHAESNAITPVGMGLAPAKEGFEKARKLGF
jgi:hypothetical protein